VTFSVGNPLESKISSALNDSISNISSPKQTPCSLANVINAEHPLSKKTKACYLCSPIEIGFGEYLECGGALLTDINNK